MRSLTEPCYEKRAFSQQQRPIGGKPENGGQYTLIPGAMTEQLSCRSREDGSWQLPFSFLGGHFLPFFPSCFGCEAFLIAMRLILLRKNETLTPSEDTGGVPREYGNWRVAQSTPPLYWVPQYYSGLLSYESVFGSGKLWRTAHGCTAEIMLIPGGGSSCGGSAS